MSAHYFPFVDLAATAAGPGFVPRAKSAEGSLRFHARCAPQCVRATGGARLARRNGGLCESFFQGGDTGFERIEACGLGLECFPKRKLVEESDDVRH